MKWASLTFGLAMTSTLVCLGTLLNEHTLLVFVLFGWPLIYQTEVRMTKIYDPTIYFGELVVGETFYHNDKQFRTYHL